jgi:hypothetical protein
MLPHKALLKAAKLGGGPYQQTQEDIFAFFGFPPGWFMIFGASVA